MKTVQDILMASFFSMLVLAIGFGLACVVEESNKKTNQQNAQIDRAYKMEIFRNGWLKGANCTADYMIQKMTVGGKVPHPDFTKDSSQFEAYLNGIEK